MKLILRVMAGLLVVGSIGWWLATGAHRGWTQTSVPKKTVDEVTGIEAVNYEKRLVIGLDLVGAACLGAAVLAGASFLFSKQTK